MWYVTILHSNDEILRWWKREKQMHLTQHVPLYTDDSSSTDEYQVPMRNETLNNISLGWRMLNQKSEDLNH